MSKIKIIPKKPVSWLRVAFWTGAIIDGKAFFLFLFPDLMPGVTKAIFNMGASDASCHEAVWLRMLVAIFDLGWTILLVWAALRPLERKSIMIITAFPIVTGILCLRIMNTINTGVGTMYIVTNFVFVFLFLFFTYSYLINCTWFTKKMTTKDK